MPSNLYPRMAPSIRHSGFGNMPAMLEVMTASTLLSAFSVTHFHLWNGQKESCVLYTVFMKNIYLVLIINPYDDL